MLAQTLFYLSSATVLPEPDDTFWHIHRLLSLTVTGNMTLQQRIIAAHQMDCYQPKHCQGPIICFTATTPMCVDLRGKADCAELCSYLWSSKEVERIHPAHAEAMANGEAKRNHHVQDVGVQRSICCGGPKDISAVGKSVDLLRSQQQNDLESRCRSGGEYRAGGSACEIKRDCLFRPDKRERSSPPTSSSSLSGTLLSPSAGCVQCRHLTDD
jgi:hypothetical protein